MAAMFFLASCSKDNDETGGGNGGGGETGGVTDVTPRYLRFNREPDYLTRLVTNRVKPFPSQLMPCLREQRYVTVL